MITTQIPLLCLCLVTLCTAFQCPSQFTNVSGTCYKIIRTGGQSWFESRRLCKQWNSEADLATIRCEKENQWIVDQFKVLSPSKQSAWIGLTGLMKNPTQHGWLIEPKPSEAKYRPWDSGQPDYYGQKELCGEMETQYGKWNDHRCEREYNIFAVCEVPSPVAGGACGYKEPVPVPPKEQRCSIC